MGCRRTGILPVFGSHGLEARATAFMNNCGPVSRPRRCAIAGAFSCNTYNRWTLRVQTGTAGRFAQATICKPLTEPFCLDSALRDDIGMPLAFLS